VSVFNRRNAVIGWIAWTATKRGAKYAAKDAARSAKPSVHPQTKHPNKSAILLGLAATVGVLAFWKKRSRNGADEFVEGPAESEPSDTTQVSEPAASGTPSQV
jgi:hypothetical protein